MKMTESFATTAAAVAPILWAIGTVEVQQVVKRMREHLHRFNLAVVAMSEASDEESVGHAQGLWGTAQRWVLRLFSLLGLYVAWGYLSLAMCVCTLDALKWLSEYGGAGDRAGARDAEAGVIYWLLASAFLFITALPAGVFAVDMVRWQRHEYRAGRAMAQLEAQAQARVRAQAADPPADGVPRS
ncbi:hypothetical protein [Streptomyces sp. SLBN-134]|uniref:hypothetical protein n=1 Tax=Streptomyces sp. SLBN-134 TaxID=2768456 RepID=UPI0011515D16|nr:hypothetical protein [Streptomyces sp. SLBN-134]